MLSKVERDSLRCSLAKQFPIDIYTQCQLLDTIDVLEAQLAEALRERETLCTADKLLEVMRERDEAREERELCQSAMRWELGVDWRESMYDNVCTLCSTLSLASDTEPVKELTGQVKHLTQMVHDLRRERDEAERLCVYVVDNCSPVRSAGWMHKVNAMRARPAKVKK